MKKLLMLFSLVLFYTPFPGNPFGSVLKAQKCYDYDCNINKAKEALYKKDFKEAIDYCKAAKVYPNAKIAETDALILKVFEAVEKEKQDAIEARDIAKKQTKIAHAERDKAEKARLTTLANDVATKSRALLDKGDVSKAFQLAELAYHYIDSQNIQVNQALVTAFYADAVASKTLVPDTFKNNLVNVVLASDEEWLAGQTKDNQVFSFNVKTKNTVETQTRHSKKISSLSFLPHSLELLTVAADTTVKKTHIRDKKHATLNLKGHESAVTSLALSPDGQWLATGTRNGSVNLWDLIRQELAFSLEGGGINGHKQEIKCLAFSPNGEWYASGSEDGMVKVINRQKNTVYSFIDHGERITSLDFSATNDKVISSSTDYTTIMWDWQRNKTVTFEDSSEIWMAQFSPDNKSIVTGDNLGDIKVWDIASKSALILRGGHQAKIIYARFINGGKKILSVSSDGIVQSWQIEPAVLIKAMHLSKHLKPMTLQDIKDNGLDNLVDIRDMNEQKLVHDPSSATIKLFAERSQETAMASEHIVDFDRPLHLFKALYQRGDTTVAPSLGTLYNKLSELYLLRKQAKEALKAAEKAISFQPYDKDIQINHAHALLFNGQMEKSLVIYKEMATAAHLSLYIQIRNYERLGFSPKGIEVIKQFLLANETKPSDPFDLEDYRWAYVIAKKNVETIRAKPNNADLLAMTLGSSSGYALFANAPQQAIAEAKESIAIKPTNWVKAHLAHGYFMLGDKTNALKIYAELKPLKDDNIGSKRDMKEVLMADLKQLAKAGIRYNWVEIAEYIQDRPLTHYERNILRKN
jgi:WD40 repeat protein